MQHRRTIARQFLLICVAYWVLLLLISAWPPLLEFLRLKLSDGHGTVSWELTYDGGPLRAVAILLGPPLGVTALWLWLSRRREVRAPSSADAR